MTDKQFDIVTFYCYGTLVDWDAGISAAFESIAAETGVSASELRSSYEEIEPSVEAGPYLSYREVLAITARRAVAHHGGSLGADVADLFADSVPLWKPFPDTNEALERLVGAGYKLGILSNVDDEILAATRRHFTVPFDLVITAQRVRSYKPAHGHFVEARSLLGETAWLHAAQSLYHDIVPTHDLGIPNAWINRRSQPRRGVVPDREFPSLAALADWLAP